ncbi:MAG: DUF2813 domain-containing protein [Bacteroidetes bacterium]|nr:MAG: DUF2813 domain-containing protein [Bacteroidota bacterium]
MEYETYLKRVKLKGYKSIQDLEIDFKPGLNIIIGKNAAGKSNFLHFLYKCFRSKFDDLYNFISELDFKYYEDNYILKAERVINKDNLKNLNSNESIDIDLLKNGKPIKGFKNNLEEIIVQPFLPHSNIIQHGIINNIYIIDKPFSFNFKPSEQLAFEVSQLYLQEETPILIADILFNLIMWNSLESHIMNEHHIKFEIEKSFEDLKILKPFLNKISPIEDIRLNKNINVFFDEYKQEFIVNNLFIEFQVNGSWLPFSSLSDGTKRLFYIILEVIGSQEKDSELRKRIILIEEPELGIHPHQFHQLMLFLKEQSHDKQIIITTHAPKTLDVLEQNELDKIIIAYNTKEQGTQMRHLSEKEISKAKKYIEDDFLSDYWMYSDLEK